MVENCVDYTQGWTKVGLIHVGVTILFIHAVIYTTKLMMVSPKYSERFHLSVTLVFVVETTAKFFTCGNPVAMEEK